MDEGVIFVATMALLSYGSVWLLSHFSLLFRRLALCFLLAFVLLAECQVLLQSTYFVPEDYTLLKLVLLYGYLPVVALFLLCSLLTLILFLVVLIRPLRRRFAPRRARLLCFCSFLLIPLQLALIIDCFNPAFLHPVIFRGSFSLTVGAVVALLLLWNVGMDALMRHLSSYELKRRRRG